MLHFSRITFLIGIFNSIDLLDLSHVHFRFIGNMLGFMMSHHHATSFLFFYFYFFFCFACLEKNLSNKQTHKQTNKQKIDKLEFYCKNYVVCFGLFSWYFFDRSGRFFRLIYSICQFQIYWKYVELHDVTPLRRFFFHYIHIKK